MGRKIVNRQHKNKILRGHQEAESQKPKTISDIDTKCSLGSCWSPSCFTAFKALLSARLCAAVWSLISDCDETFNYWEPVLVFCFIRCVLGFAAALSEAYFYKAIKIRFGDSVARLMLAFSLFACGMFISSAAYLPSSFSMYFTMFSLGAWLHTNYAVSIVCVAVSAFIGWPFAAILGAPIAIDVLLYERKVSLFLKWCVVSIIVILGPLVFVDSHYFGKIVVAPFNIVSYNVFSSNGPELYGTEPWTFYFVNGFLNFNFVFVAALGIAPLLIIDQLTSPAEGNRIACLTVLPLYIWIVIFFIQPHKEERFLFPIYPLFSFCGAFALDTFQKMLSTFIKWRGLINTFQLAFIGVCTILAISRSLALYQGYRAPFEVFMEVNRIEQEMKPHLPINLCVGKEWHRFPSSFFLPDKWNLQFIESEFRGQLPKPFANFPNATTIIPENMNELNLEETSRYVDIKMCHYLVDLDVLNESPREPNYSKIKSQWEVVFTSKFLDTARSPHLLRSFYVPSLTEANCHYVDYNLLKAKETKVKWLTKSR